MREPYLITFSAFALWGFVELFHRIERSVTQPPEKLLTLDLLSKSPGAHLSRAWSLTMPGRAGEDRSAWFWLGLGLLGMLLVSPVVALVTLIIFAGWMFFTSERGNISWKTILILLSIFVAGLFFLSSSLNRSGEFDATSPLHVINDWLRLAVKWDAYQLERESGWVQKLFDEMPEWMRLPFIAIYGTLQHVLPAALIVPTKFIWKVIYVAALARLVLATSDVDPLLRSRGRIIWKDAESCDVAIASRVDLDLACRVTWGRRQVG